MLIVADVGALKLLADNVAGKLAGATIHVFKNDYTPTEASVLGDFTEANFASYAYITSSGWSAPALNAGNKAETVATLATWTMGTPGTTNTIYGVFVKSAAGDLLFAERNPAGGILMATAGQTWSWLPKFTGNSE